MKQRTASNASSLRRAYWAFHQDGLAGFIKALLPRNRLGDCVWGIWKYTETFHRLPNLLFPKDYNEYVLRLMMSSEARSKLRETISDKEFVKEYVRQKLGEGFTPRTIAVLRSREEALAYSYPDTCVIKATHTSGHVIIRKNSSPPLDTEAIGAWFDIDYSEILREPNYRYLERKVIVEEYLSEPGQETPRDYKIFCFRGRPAYIQVDTGRFSGHQRNILSTNWRELDFQILHPRCSTPVPRPPNLQAMLDAAAKLSADFSFIRVDFYRLENSFYVGELTNFPGGATEGFTPESAGLLAAKLFAEPTLDVETLFGVYVEPKQT